MRISVHWFNGSLNVGYNVPLIFLYSIAHYPVGDGGVSNTGRNDTSLISGLNPWGLLHADYGLYIRIIYAGARVRSL